MLTLYAFGEGAVSKKPISDLPPTLPPAVWLDLLDPTPAEILAVQQATRLELPTREEMQEIEVSSRLYEENGALFITATLVSQVESGRPETQAVTFVLSRHALVTIRYADPLPFLAFSQRAQRTPTLLQTSDMTLIGLLEAVVDRLADVLERASADIDRITRAVFDRATPRQQRQGPALQDALDGVGRAGALISDVTGSLISLRRAAVFFQTAAAVWLHRDTKGRLKILSRDVAALTEHAGFLSQKANFLLDATLGMINIEQNAIIKIFSVAAVAFLPPTLVASLYGMNFQHMPELAWDYGYPMALVLMALSALLPFLYFRRRGWL